MRQLSRPGVAMIALLAAGSGAASAQDFADFETIGRLEDVRRQPTPLTVAPHSFEPSIEYKLLGITTPHVFGALTLGHVDNLLRQDGDVPGLHLRREPYGRAEAGVRLDTLLGEHRVELEYRALATEYTESGEFDTAEQRASLRGDLLWNDVSVHGDASYTRAAYPQSIQLRGLVRLDVYAGNVWAEVRWNRAGLRLGLGGRRNDYLEPELRDFDHRAFGPSIQAYFRATPKLRVVAEYDYERLRYDERDALDGYQVHTLRGGVDGEVTAKITASLKVGASFLDTDDDGDGREFRGFTAELSARWEVLARTTLIGSYRRGLDPSVSSNFLVSDDVELSVAQKLFDDKVTARAFGAYGHALVSPGEHLNRIRAGASVLYLIQQWLSVGAGYEFEKLASGFPDDDYEAHSVYLSIGAGL